MKVVLHDLEPSRFESLYPKLARDSFIVGEEGFRMGMAILENALEPAGNISS